MIIYPPYLPETIPAFSSNTLIIPFINNPVVNFNTEVQGYKLMIKDCIEINKTIVTLKLERNDNNTQYNTETNSGTIKFDTTGVELIANKYYKFQLSYIDDVSSSPVYSTVSIGRCIGDKPEIKIEKNTEYTYQGIYTHKAEALYSYRFILKYKDLILDDTKDIFYNNQTNPNILYNIQYDLVQNEKYNLIFSITTINGYTDQVKYEIQVNNESSFDDFTLAVGQDKKAIDNGYVKLQLQGDVKPGEYVIERRIKNERKWDELIKFVMGSQTADLNNFIWADYTVEQGIIYEYTIKEYIQTDKGYGPRLTPVEISIDFEDSYLISDNKQLKIKYNPKISSFKDNLQEQKIETLGSQYPFFFRGGTVKYKEFPISGMISYLMDEDGMFVKDEELGLSNTSDSRDKITAAAINKPLRNRTTQLVDYNYTAERLFKLKVLEWLNDGKPKLFRSPAEGNYIVRLMNVSLSPDDTLGRMLHSFNATAYEVGNTQLEDLIANTKIDLSDNSHFRPVSPLGLFVLGINQLW